MEEGIKVKDVCYKLISCGDSDLDKLIAYKKETVLEYANNITLEERQKIIGYINDQVKKDLDFYKFIIVENKICGCLLVKKDDKTTFIDEIYIEEEYRNKGIGSNILKEILECNKYIYLWVYKCNRKAISLYKRFGFDVDIETDTRYRMKYIKL